MVNYFLFFIFIFASLYIIWGVKKAVSNYKSVDNDQEKGIKTSSEKSLHEVHQERLNSWQDRFNELFLETGPLPCFCDGNFSKCAKHRASSNIYRISPEMRLVDLAWEQVIISSLKGNNHHLGQILKVLSPIDRFFLLEKIYNNRTIFDNQVRLQIQQSNPALAERLERFKTIHPREEYDPPIPGQTPAKKIIPDSLLTDVPTS